MIADLVLLRPVWVERGAQEQNKNLRKSITPICWCMARCCMPGLGPRDQQGRRRRDGGLRDRHHEGDGCRSPYAVIRDNTDHRIIPHWRRPWPGTAGLGPGSHCGRRLVKQPHAQLLAWRMHS